MANASQLFLLADHIKLSLLERQRAISLNLEPNSQDGTISRSLESMREGIESLEQQVAQISANGSDPTASPLQDQLTQLHTQYSTLSRQFLGFTNPTPPTITLPNDPSLAPSFAAAQAPNPSPPHPSKSVRFTDPDDPDSTAARTALFPYRDTPPSPPSPSGLDNVQIHEYHKAVLRDQDEHLDQLGESIGRQRELSIRMGDELDEHVLMLDEVDGHVERHLGRLEGARRRLGGVARKAGENKQVVAIGVLIAVLVLLVVVLK